MTREEIIDNLSKTVMVDIALSGEVHVEKLADWHLSQLKYVVEPLKNLEWSAGLIVSCADDIDDAVYETMKRATEEKQ